MKKLITLIFFISILSVSAQRPDSVITSTHDTTITIKLPVTVVTHYVFTVTPPVIIDTIPPVVVTDTGIINGLYFDNTDQRLGTQDENTMIQLIKRDHFNAVLFYNLGSCFSNASLRVKLAAFIKKLRQNGVKRIIAIDASSFDAVIAWNDAQTDPLCIFNWLNLEQEYWNNTTDPVGAFVKDSSDVRRMMAKVGTHGIQGAEQYNGHFKDPLKSRAAMLIAKFQSDAAVHDYAASPNTDYVPYRRDSLNACYKLLGIKGEYIGLHSSEDIFYGDEYKSWGIDSVNNVKKRIFNSKHFSNMNWKGVYVFDFKWYVKWNAPTTAVGNLLRAASPFALPKSKVPTPVNGAEPEHILMSIDPNEQ